MNTLQKQSSCTSINLKKKHFYRLLALLAIFSLTATALRGDTFVSGNVAGTWTTNGSPYIVQSKAMVAFATQLTIDPGVVVRFQTGAGIEVRGAMIAEGTTNNQILFTSDQAIAMPGDWDTIKLVGEYILPESTISLRNCIVEYGATGIYAFADTQSQDGSSTRLAAEAVTIRLCSQHGIKLWSTGSSIWTGTPAYINIEMGGCVIYSNGISGIQCEAMRYASGGHVTGTIKNTSVFANGQNGIVYNGDSAKPNLWNNIIWANGAAGITMTAYVGDIRNNIIVSNIVGVTGSSVNGLQNVTFNNVWANGTNWAKDATRYETATGNISQNPLCANPGAGDFHLRSQAGRYDPAADVWVRDTVTSPCIDAGDPASAWANEPQPNGERINMGSDGNTPFASKPLRTLRGTLDKATMDFVLSWGCALGETYTVLYSSSPTGPWLDDLPGSRMTADSTQTSLSYTNINGGTQTIRFYRVRWNTP